MMEVLRKTKKKVGSYYRFSQTYLKNKQVFNQLIDLSNKPLTYYSVLKQSEIDEKDVLSQVQLGDVILVRNLIGQLDLQKKFNELINSFFGIEYDHLTTIHKEKTISEIVDSALNVRHSVPTLVLQSSIMHRLLTPHVSASFLELMPNLRLHLPYGKVKAHEEYIESRMGRGKLNPHGQHKDSWRFHPKNTINVWIALSEANDTNGLSILPKSANYQPKFDEQAQEIASGVKTYPSQQWVTDMQAGDAAIFEAELLHGSIINTSKNTRACLSMRCAPSEPKFHKDLTYNYIKVEDGKFDNLSWSKLSTKNNFAPLSRDITFKPAEELHTGFIPESYDNQKIVIKIDGDLKEFPRHCPHAGTDMLNGELNEHGDLICPSHRMCLKGKKC